jgi:hypothetical protein
MKLIWRLQKLMVHLFRMSGLDVTGAKLAPGDPERCQGNGKHSFFECCCDECDYYMDCFKD